MTGDRRNSDNTRTHFQLLTQIDLRSLILAAISLFALANPGSAQAPGLIRGVVLDSIHNDPLAGAMVTIMEPNPRQSRSLVVSTDAAGRFAWQPVDTGVYSLTVQHPVLDSIGVVLQASAYVPNDRAVSILLAVPSVRTVQRTYCGNQSSGNFIVGRVMRGTATNPVEKAKVTMDWYTVSADRKAGVKSEYSSRSTETDAWGHYAFCDLPTEFEASLSAASDSAATPRVTFSETQGLSLVPWLFVPDAGFPPSELSGQVFNNNTPLPGATIEALGMPIQVVSGPDGRFHLPVIATGTTLIRARKIGFTASIFPVNVTSGGEEPLIITLEKPGSSLQTIVVRERMNAVLFRSGFTERARRGIGSYMDAAEIQRSRTTCVVDLIRRRTGAVSRGHGCSTVSASDVGRKYGFGFRGIETLRNRMPDPPGGEGDAPKPKYQSTQLGVNIFVDGFQESAEFKSGEVDLGWLDAKDVVGIEVYTDTRGGVSIWIWTTAYNGINRGLTRPAP